MDDFAQTAAPQSSLFDDYEESMQTRAQDDLFADDFTPVEEPEVVQEVKPTPTAPSAPTQSSGPSSRGRGGANGARGRGRGGRGSHFGAPAQSRDIQTTSSTPPAVAKAPDAAPANTPSSLLESRHAPSTPATTTAAAAPNTTTTAAPTEARSTKPDRPTSVRGDRSATGGFARPKLTEEELTARLASAKARNATLEAAHARAEADAASFAAREDEAAKRRVEERRDRAQMMGEREKNRLRKLKAQGGREWDSDKREEDFQDRRKGPGRGAQGGIVGTRLGDGGGRDAGNGGDWEKEYVYREGRGGGRGGRGGRGRGNGDARKQEGRQSTPQADDFPVLAAGKTDSKTKDGGEAAPKLSFPSKKKEEKPADISQILADDGTGTGTAKQSWADMVEEGGKAV